MISAKGLTKIYGSGEGAVQALKGVDLEIEEGSFTVILGASGSGKSTLLNVLSGLERADSGTIFYGDTDISKLSDKEMTKFRRDNIGFIFQQYYLLPNMNVDKNVKMGAALAGNSNYKEIINAVGLGDKLYKYPHELSGGEQQRVAIARALAKKPKTLFADEPTGALDEDTGRQILNYLATMYEKYNISIVAVTHNRNIADMADRVIEMNSGRICSDSRNKAKKSAYEIDW